MKEFVHNFPGRSFSFPCLLFRCYTMAPFSGPKFHAKEKFLPFDYVNVFSSAFFYNFYYPCQKLPQVYSFHDAAKPGIMLFEGSLLCTTFSNNKFLLRQTISWLMGNWLSSFSLVTVPGKRMEESIFMTRERVLFATPFDPSKACFAIESFHERRFSRRHFRFSSFPSLIKRELLTSLDLHSEGFPRTKVKWKTQRRQKLSRWKEWCMQFTGAEFIGADGNRTRGSP